MLKRNVQFAISTINLPPELPELAIDVPDRPWGCGMFLLEPSLTVFLSILETAVGVMV